jgi:anti-sigma factor RsiW
MTARDHERFRDDVGAYLLGALDEQEVVSFEAHMELCHVCREDVERLQVAVDVLPRSVEQFNAPDSLKRSLMEIVNAEAGATETQPARVRLGQRLTGLLPTRPRLALVAAATVLAIGAAGGFGISQLVSDDGDTNAGRTVAAKVDHRRLPDGQATLDISGDGEKGGILRVSRFKQLPAGRVYQAWIDRGGQISPQPTFEVTADGRGAVALPSDLRGVDNVYVSREPRGGSQAPSEVPIVQAKL